MYFNNFKILLRFKKIVCLHYHLFAENFQWHKKKLLIIMAFKLLCLYLKDLNLIQIEYLRLELNNLNKSELVNTFKY